MIVAADLVAAIWGAVWASWMVDRPWEDQVLIKVAVLYNLPPGTDEGPVR